MKDSLHIESNVLGRVLHISQTRNICKLEFYLQYNFSALEKVRKITKITLLICFSTRIQCIKISWCHKFSEVGTFLWLSQYFLLLDEILI